MYQTKMRFLAIIITLLLPLSLLAQDSLKREKLSTNASYEYALREYVSKNPASLVYLPGTRQRVAFVKKQEYLSNIKDTLNGVKVRLIDASKDMDSLVQYFPKKQDFVLLDIPRMIGRADLSFIWVLPMKTAFNPKKKTIATPKYEKKSCKYTYEFTPNHDGYFLFKEAECKDME